MNNLNVIKVPTGHWSCMDLIVTYDDKKINVSIEIQPDGEWAAFDSDNYEAESDSVGFWSNSIVGHGKTLAEAFSDFMEQIWERDNA